MAHYLPPALMSFFRPPPPLPYKPPLDEKKKLPPYTGVSQNDIPLPIIQKTPQQLRDERRNEKHKIAKSKLEEERAKWDPNTPNDISNYTEDAYKTLFVGRLHYDLTAEDIKSEFEYYGRIKRVCLVKDKNGKSRGYAFVEFEHDKDLKEAYKDADGRKLKGRRIVVDVERARTVEGFYPVRLGGTLGGATRHGKKVSGRRVIDPDSYDDEPPRSDRMLSGHKRRHSDRDRDRTRDRYVRRREESGDRERDRIRDRDRTRDRDRDRTRDRDRIRDRDRTRDRERRSSRKRSRSPRQNGDRRKRPRY